MSTRRNIPLPPRRQAPALHPRAFAMVMVLMVISLVAVLGFAMLSSASLQTQAAANAGTGDAADALAESGLNLAMYYLQNPLKAPGGGAYWPGQNDVTFGADVPGAADVAVTSLGNYAYQIVSTGKLTRGGTEFTRTLTAQITVAPGYQVRHAAGFGQAVSLVSALNVTGDVQAGGSLAAPSTPTITGKIYAPANTFSAVSPLLAKFVATPAASLTLPPSAASLKDYKTYSHNGASYSAVRLGSGALGGTSAAPSLVPTGGSATAANPAPVSYWDGDLTLNGHVQVTGTLIVDGDLYVNGTNNTITAAENYPALIVKGSIRVKGTSASKALTVSGLVWVGGNVREESISIPSNINITGALLFGGTGGVNSMTTTKVNVTYNQLKATVPDLDTTVAQQSVKVTSWKQK